MSANVNVTAAVIGNIVTDHPSHRCRCHSFCSTISLTFIAVLLKLPEINSTIMHYKIWKRFANRSSIAAFTTY